MDDDDIDLPELIEHACDKYIGKIKKSDREDFAEPLAKSLTYAVTKIVLRNRIEEFLSVDVALVPIGFVITSQWMADNEIGTELKDPISFQRIISFEEAADWIMSGNYDLTTEKRSDLEEFREMLSALVEKVDDAVAKMNRVN